MTNEISAVLCPFVTALLPLSFPGTANPKVTFKLSEIMIDADGRVSLIFGS